MLILENKILLKSAYDNRLFNYIQLANGLRILLVQDPNCTKSACSVTLNVGHFNDDIDCQGICHLLEHMLFLGNDEFEDANAFNDFITTSGGSINAQTGTEYTSYFYEVSAEHEHQAIAHFRAMLCGPTFSETHIEKEVKAINAEFLLKKKDDLRRLYQVHKETCNPAHPFSQFSVGNQQTFAPFITSQIKTKLHALYDAYYRPDNACLCVVSQQPIAATENIIRQQFSSWLTKNSFPKEPLPNLYLEHQLGVQINILPLQKAKRLILTFALPEQHSYFRSKPLHVLSHILGDEGDGGLLDFYKTKNWATSLSAGGGIEGSTFKDFNINLQLTDAGIIHTDQVINALFSYIQLIQDNGIERWRIEETATLNQLMWDFSDRAKAINEATHYSQAMFEYPAEFVVAGDFILDQINEASILHMLSFFRPDNMRVKVVNPNVKTDRVANWYETPYSITAIESDRLASFQSHTWKAHFTLPKANQFLPKCQPIKPVLSKFLLPKKIVSQQGLEIWYGQDDKFKQPKGDCFLTFDCLAVNEGIHITTAKRLWIALLNEKLNQKYYQANLAGMHFHFYPHQGGFSLQTNGFSGTQLEYCTSLLTQIVLSDDFSHNFSQIKAKQFQGLSNSLLNKPINALFSKLAVLMQQQNHDPADMAQVMEKLTLQNIAETKEKLLNQFHIEGLMFGDWSEIEALKVSSDIKQFRAMHSSCNKIKRGVVDIRQSDILSYRVNSQHDDSAVVIYFQAPNKNVKTEALTILLEQLLATPFFNQLRTEQQLGYLVGTGYIPYNQHPGIGFYIQSPQHSVDFLIDAIHLFLEQTMQNIADYAEAWDVLKNGVIKQLMEKDTSLSMKSQRLWMAIGNNDTSFTYNSLMIESIRNIEFSELITYFNSLVLGREFGEIIMYTPGIKGTVDSHMNEIKDIQSYKSNCQFL